MNGRIVILLCCVMLGVVHAGGDAARAGDQPDWARETRLADQTVDAILDGDPEWLSAEGREFLSILTEADNAEAAVIIMHGRGFHPDWVDVVNPLRVGLVDHGFSTLSLQMPVLQKDAKYYDYVNIFPAAYPRIEAGIDFLRQAGYAKVYLLAHSCSVHMVMAWVREHGDSGFEAFVGLGMGATDYQQPMREPFPLERMQVPVLDLYGEHEFPAVIRFAPDRLKRLQQAGNPKSKQVILAGADHYFTDYGDALLEQVAAWLASLE